MNSRSGSSSSRYKSVGGRIMCNCGLPAKIRTSWTDKNPFRKFFGCELFKEGETNQCGYFKWFDEEDVKGWPKRALIQARDEIIHKNKVINELNTKIMELSEELEKHKMEIEELEKHKMEITAKSNDYEDSKSVESGDEVGWMKKILRKMCFVM